MEKIVHYWCWKQHKQPRDSIENQTIRFEHNGSSVISWVSKNHLRFNAEPNEQTKKSAKLILNKFIIICGVMVNLCGATAIPIWLHKYWSPPLTSIPPLFCKWAFIVEQKVNREKKEYYSPHIAYIHQTECIVDPMSRIENQRAIIKWTIKGIADAFRRCRSSASLFCQTMGQISRRALCRAVLCCAVFDPYQRP